MLYISVSFLYHTIAKLTETEIAPEEHLLNNVSEVLLEVHTQQPQWEVLEVQEVLKCWKSMEVLWKSSGSPEVQESEHQIMMEQTECLKFELRTIMLPEMRVKHEIH